MKFLSGVIALSSGLWMHVYVYGLENTSSAAFNGIFYFYAFCLFILGFVSIYRSFNEKK